MEKKQKKRIGGVWQDRDSGVWRYRFMWKGRRYFGTVPGAKNKTDAKNARDKRIVAVREGRDQEPQSKRSTNFEKFVKETFLPWVETNLSPGTHRSYKWRCDDLIKEFGSLDLSEISPFAVATFKRKQLKRKTRRGESQSPASVNRYLQVIQSIFTRAEELELFDKDKRPKVSCFREENERLRYLSTEEERKLLAAAAKWPHLQDLIVVALATGLRREELFGLKPADVDLHLNLVTVIGKGSKLRTVPLDPEGKAWVILERRKRESRSGWIFTSPHSGGKLTRVDKSLAAAASAAKVEDVTLHILRHTFCTRLAATGVDVRTIQELAGHEEIETTMKYVHLVERNLHQAVRRLTAYQENYHEFTTAEVVNIVANRA